MNENHLFQGMGLTSVESKKSLNSLMPKDLVELLDIHRFLHTLIPQAQESQESSDQWGFKATNGL